MSSPNARDCDHGSLRRSCEICERDERIRELEAEVAELRKDKEILKEFYEPRFNLLQKQQKKMRYPERTMVCDILANGSLRVGGYIIIDDAARLASEGDDD